MKVLNLEKFRHYINKTLGYDSKDYTFAQVSGKLKTVSHKADIVKNIDNQLDFVMDPQTHNDSFPEVLALFD